MHWQITSLPEGFPIETVMTIATIAIINITTLYLSALDNVLTSRNITIQIKAIMISTTITQDDEKLQLAIAK